MYTIKQLRQNGYKVRVYHLRNVNTIQRIGGTSQLISNFGGSTKIELTTPDMSETVTGEARCSLKENFNKRIGNSVALGRALAQLKSPIQIN